MKGQFGSKSCESRNWEAVIRHLINEPAEEYHAQAGRFLSSHRLADFRHAPLLFRKKELGQVMDVDRPAYEIGRATHTLVLEGRQAYSEQYAVGGPVNPKTGKLYGSRTKAFEAWAEAQGKSVLTDEQAALVENLKAGVDAHDRAPVLLEAGVPEGVLRVEYCGVDCQARFDFINPEYGLVDLKTCDNLDYLESDARKFGYVYQLAFYRAVVEAATDMKLPVFIVAVEKREPFRCGVWEVGRDVLGIAQRENEGAIARLKDCRKRDVWPTGYEGLRTLDWI